MTPSDVNKLNNLYTFNMLNNYATFKQYYQNYISMARIEMTIRERGRGQGSRCTLSQLQPIECPISPPELDLILQSSGIIVE